MSAYTKSMNQHCWSETWTWLKTFWWQSSRLSIKMILRAMLRWVMINLIFWILDNFSVSFEVIRKYSKIFIKLNQNLDFFKFIFFFFYARLIPSSLSIHFWFLVTSGSWKELNFLHSSLRGESELHCLILTTSAKLSWNTLKAVQNQERWSLMWKMWDNFFGWNYWIYDWNLIKTNLNFSQLAAKYTT